jgi:chromosomal replication initiator protein
VSNTHVWRAAQERLRQQMTRAQFETWLSGTRLAEASGGVTVLYVRTTFAKELLEARYRERIEAAIADITGSPCALHIAVTTGPAHDDTPPAPADLGKAGSPVGQFTSRLGAHHSARANAVRSTSPSLFETEVELPPVIPVERGRRASGPLTNGRRRHLPPVGTGAAGRSSRVRAALGRARGNEDGGAEDEMAGGLASELREEGADVMGDEQSTGGQPGPQRHAPLRQAHPAESLPLDLAAGNGGYLANQIPPPRLNPRYTFATFIVGGGNRLAHAASQAVSEAPGQAYNPLFLYGGVGLGKTHLLHAIGHTAIFNNLLVLYVSSETFTNEIINAIRYRTTEEFRAKYRSVDVLLVDDIQFIAGKESTEEEFFHTFNTLHESNKQIVICSDRPPKAIVSLEERLRSRFEWGLIADIQPPDLETRVAILRAKSDMLGAHVPDDVVNYLATRVQSNIRELEGSFNRLLAVAKLQNVPLTIDTAKAAMSSLQSDGRQRRVSIAEVLEAVAEHYRIPPSDLCGKQRDKHIVGPRQVAMYLMRQETEASLLEIGQALGGRDHSTVLHGCDKIAREVNDNTTLRKEVLAIRQALLG